MMVLAPAWCQPTPPSALATGPAGGDLATDPLKDLD